MRQIRNIGIIRVLGYGSYNVAFLTTDGTVLRVAAVENQDTLRTLQRGDAVSRLLSLYKDQIGPCLLRLITPGNVLIGSNELPKGVFDEPRAARLLRGKNTYYASEIEYANMGDMYRKTAPTKDIFDTFMFMLLWFFHVARSTTGFFHHDLKPQNMFMKELNAPTTFAFQLEEALFVFPNVRFVPIVADYDFASVPVTNENDRKSVGTSIYVPPEHLLDLLRGHRLQRLARTYDLYAVGQAMLQFCIGAEIFIGMQDEVMTYAYDSQPFQRDAYNVRDFDGSIGEPDRDSWMAAILFQAVVQFVVGLPPWCLGSSVFMPHYRILIAKPRVIAAQRRAMQFPNEMAWLRATLLSPNPADREPDNSLLGLLHHEYFSRFETYDIPAGSILYQYDEDYGLETEPTREMQRDPLLCSQCKTAFTFTQCQCCDVPICGQTCQMEKHKE
jgi:serine/threonine protein kinase